MWKIHWVQFGLSESFHAIHLLLARLFGKELCVRERLLSINMLHLLIKPPDWQTLSPLCHGLVKLAEPENNKRS